MGEANREANGEERVDKEDVVELVVEDSKVTVVEAVEEANTTLDLMIHSLATVVGCVAIWPVTTPRTHRHRGNLILVPLEEDSLNPGNRAQEDVVENAQSGSVELMYFMMRKATSIQWMMLVSCTFHLLRTMLWVFSRLRRKTPQINKQTKEVLCQCGEGNHDVFNWTWTAESKEKYEGGL